MGIRGREESFPFGFSGVGFPYGSVLAMRGDEVAVRKTDSEFGGRGGLHPPAEFVPVLEELESWEQASLERRTDGPGRPSVGAPDDAVQARAEREKRARLNDTVGK